MYKIKLKEIEWKLSSLAEKECAFVAAAELIYAEDEKTLFLPKTAGLSRHDLPSNFYVEKFSNTLNFNQEQLATSLVQANVAISFIKKACMLGDLSHYYKLCKVDSDDFSFEKMSTLSYMEFAQNNIRLFFKKFDESESEILLEKDFMELERLRDEAVRKGDWVRVSKVTTIMNKKSANL